jgi:maltose/moltooligosaccharide transporter
MPVVARAGAISYTRRSLYRLFFGLLAGEVIFTLIDMIEPKVLPVLPQFHGASNTEIGVIVGSLNVMLQLLIMPPLGYYSDRLRTRWGRRIPLLMCATPFACLLLAITPFAPEIAAAVGKTAHLGDWMRAIPIKPVILVFAAMVVLYRVAQTVMNTTFFGLLRDVVPGFPDLSSSFRNMSWEWI